MSERIIISKISRFSRILFWILTPFVLILIAFSGYYLYQYFSTEREINLSVSVPANAMVGVPFDLSVDFDNSSKNTLQDVNLSVFLPESAIILGESGEKRVFSKKIDDLEPDAIFKDKFQILIVAGEGSVKNFNISVGYVSTLKARFEKKQNVEVSVRESAVKLDLSAPEKVLNNEEFEIIVNYANISENNFSGARLNFIFPKNFVLKESNPKLSGNILEIGELEKNAQAKISLKGRIIGPEQSFFEIKSQIETAYRGQKYAIAEKAASVYIAPSPLSLKIILNETENYIAWPGDLLKYRIVYQNNSDVVLSDAVITAQLNGEIFDFPTLKTGGSFNSRNNILVWNAANVSNLRQVPAGSSAGTEFEIKTKQFYPIKKLSDKNFVLKVVAEISSPTVPYYVSADKTIGLSGLETKVGGQISVEPAVYFRDPSGIVNKGVLPPRVNQPLNFTIHWLVKNYATDVKDVNIKASLLSGARLTDIVKSSVASQPIYNERTSEINWSIDRISAAKGIIGKPIEAIFQIEVLPNITQVGKEIPLLSQTIAAAVDEFTGVELNVAAEALSTKSLKDSGLDLNYTQVIQ